MTASTSNEGRFQRGTEADYSRGNRGVQAELNLPSNGIGGTVLAGRFRADLVGLNCHDSRGSNHFVPITVRQACVVALFP